ncbi:MAG: PEP-CTERM sorting domain-containing protein [Phycisphaerales bacterium]|nr:PEP-CTERM sorting domain-containing protein [Phycisphaerales bacterium]
MNSPIACLLCATIAGVATAGITPVSPFTGTLQETFESFQNIRDNPNVYQDASGPFPIFLGAATMVGPSTAIYRPGYANFSLGSNGFAQVADGAQGAGLNGLGAWTIRFGPTGASDFGGYWSYLPDFHHNMSFDFYDPTGSLLGSDSLTVNDNSGALHWAGWTSTSPIATVVITGDFMAGDYLQANVPAPGALVLLGLGALGAQRRRS